MRTALFWDITQRAVVGASWNVMAHAQKPDFVFRRNGPVHLNRRGLQFSRLLAAEVCASAVVMLDTPCSEVVWRVLATHSIRQFPLHFPSLRRHVPSHLNWSLNPHRPFRDHLSLPTSSPFNMGPIDCPETSVMNCPCSAQFSYCLSVPSWGFKGGTDRLPRKVGFELPLKLDSNKLTKTKNWSGRNEVTETSGRLHPLWLQDKQLHTPRTTDYRHTRQDRWIQTELASTLAKNATNPNPFEIILLQTTRKENNWKTEEALARAAVTVETERIKGSNPWCLWWW